MYSSMIFLENIPKSRPFPVECVQTDNEFEFTKRFGSSKSNKNLKLFEKKLAKLGIEHKKIHPFTQRHNRKSGTLASQR